MKLQQTAAVVALGFGLLSSVAYAAPITYTLTSQEIGYDSHNDIVTTSGTITTDGTAGTLSTNNIIAFDIVLTQGTLGSLTLTNNNASEDIVGDNLKASTNGLSWDYTHDTGAEFSVVTNSSPNTLAQFHLYLDRTDVDFGTIEHYTDYNGPAVVATNSLSAVPLPASAPMFGAALVALGVIGYGVKRNSKAAA